MGTPQTSGCHHNLVVIQEVCRITGTPLEMEKVEGPASCLAFLGLELNTVKMEIRLPAEKLSHLRQLTSECKGRKAGKKRDVLSLIGSLSHACKAVRQGRSFLRRLITLASSVQRLDHYVRLNATAQSDIHWWFQFAKCWNGISMLGEIIPTCILCLMFRVHGGVAPSVGHSGSNCNGQPPQTSITSQLKSSSLWLLQWHCGVRTGRERRYRFIVIMQLQ